jgi:hypothetical protein
VPRPHTIREQRAEKCSFCPHPPLTLAHTQCDLGCIWAIRGGCCLFLWLLIRMMLVIVRAWHHFLSQCQCFFGECKVCKMCGCEVFCCVRDSSSVVLSGDAHTQRRSCARQPCDVLSRAVFIKHTSMPCRVSSYLVAGAAPPPPLPPPAAHITSTSSSTHHLQKQQSHPSVHFPSVHCRTDRSRNAVEGGWRPWGRIIRNGAQGEHCRHAQTANGVVNCACLRFGCVCNSLSLCTVPRSASGEPGCAMYGSCD